MIVCDRQGREYRLQVNGDGDSYFIAKLLYRNSTVGMLHCILYPPDKWVIGDLIIHSDVIHTPSHLGAVLWRLAVKPKPIDYRRIGLGTHSSAVCYSKSSSAKSQADLRFSNSRRYQQQSQPCQMVRETWI